MDHMPEDPSRQSQPHEHGNGTSSQGPEYISSIVDSSQHQGQTLNEQGVSNSVPIAPAIESRTVVTLSDGTIIGYVDKTAASKTRAPAPQPTAPAAAAAAVETAQKRNETAQTAPDLHEPSASSSGPPGNDLKIDSNSFKVPPPSNSSHGLSNAAQPAQGGPSPQNPTTVKPTMAAPVTPTTGISSTPLTQPSHRSTQSKASRGQATARGVSRGGRGRRSRAGLLSATSRKGAKRRRKSKDDGGDSDASEEITLPALSSSGRRITQVNNSQLSPAPRSRIKTIPSSNASTPTSAFTLNRPPPRKKRTPGAEVAAVCNNCHRGPSPQSNRIVFCDGCDTPWHQYCHDPPIEQSVISIAEKEWHCADCQIFTQLKQGVPGRVTAAEVTERTGVEMGLKRRQDYLSSLRKETLVALLLYASVKDEDLLLYDYLTPIPTQAPYWVTCGAAATNHTSTTLPIPPKTQPTPKEPGTALVLSVNPSTDPDYDDYYEEPLPYPKMGNGIPITTAGHKEDLAIMIDDNIDGAISHSWQDERGEWVGTLARQRSGLDDALAGPDARERAMDGSRNLARSVDAVVA